MIYYQGNYFQNFTLSIPILLLSSKTFIIIFKFTNSRIHKYYYCDSSIIIYRNYSISKRILYYKTLNLIMKTLWVRITTDTFNTIFSSNCNKEQKTNYNKLLLLLNCIKNFNTLHHKTIRYT